MTNETQNSEDIEMIKKTVQHYINGAISGSGAEMKPAFHDEATIYGYIGEDLFAGPIQKLFDWNDENGAAAGLQSNISKIDLVGTTAQVKLDLDNWTGHKFTDYFNLLKTDGSWKIMNKVFHLHT
ncbi:MAG: nuclear transport factor 2 family protein [Hyphomicrobiales bacterium]